ncbi:MAG: response regulator, partial [Acidobacteriota bacterium]
RHEPGNPNSLLDNSVITTLEDSTGDVWIATAQGLSRLDVERNTFTHIRPDPGDPQGLIDTIQCLLEVKPGELWIGGIGGLNRLDVASGRLDQFGERRTILDMLADPSGVLWLASYGHGLMHFDPETETLATYRHEFENSTSPSSNLLATLHRDQAGTLWIGSLGGGLNRFEAETETFTHFREQDGLANDNITDILEDSNGNLWLATRRGLSRFHPETETWSTYTLNDGLQGSVFNSGTGVLSATGALLFGGTGGITRFRPEQLAGAAQPPKVAITDFLLLNRSTPFSARRSAEPGDALPHLVLDHRDDVFAFQFAALDFAQPSLNRYAYIMEGFQQDWVESDAGNRLAQFTNLDAGEYVFRVKAANADGVWSTEDAAVRITVLPPPWQTWWAYSLYALAAMGAGLSYLRSHRSALRNEQETAKQEREAAQRERLVSQRLREVDKLKDEFLANTSHELKTPLYGITGLAESLIEGATGELPEQTRTNLSMIVASGRRLSHLVNDLLDFSKLRHQSLELALRPVDLRSLAEVVLLLSRPLVGSKPLTLENQVPPGLPAVHADENRLQQILYNLIGNAIKFTESGSVTVAACLEGDKVLVRVADTGVGIPMAAQERIFNAFEQADASIERAYGGTGLGLAVTRQLVEAHGGDITVESTEGEGAVFSFSLPVAQQAPAVEGARPSSTELAPPPAPLATSIAPERVAAGPASPEEHAPDRAPSGSRVLVVDDEPVNLQVLKNYLAMEDFQLTLASSGEEALRLLGEQTFDLVLLDVMMPKLSGYEVCRTLRESHPLAELPVIFLTARAQDSDVITGIELGANDYLTKPISKDRLLARIRPHLSLLGVHRNLEDLVEEKMSEVKVLRGLLPICASCKKIRDEDGDWHNLELFIDRRSEAKFTHGLCPNCVENYLS